LVKASVPYVLQGKFRIEERVGAGAMGVVYRAVDLDLGRTVAIKTLPSMSLNYSLQLRREARVMATVQHPNLAMIHGAETWRGTPLLVFEYLDGGTLQERIRRAPMAVDEILELGLALAGVLHQIHEAGILHRDVKPSNIGYTGDGQAKLMDFGLAHIIFEAHHQSISTRALDDPLPPTEDGSGQDSESENTWTRRLVGTPVYMSPEAVRCEPPGPGFDLWSLSIVLYEALAGRNPVQGDNVRETLSYIVDRDIPDIREMRSDLTEPVAQFFHLALSRNKSRRPQDAPEMKARLERTRAEVASEKHTTRRPDYGNQIALGHGS
jgi:serine/threonine protein kinase